MRSFGLKTSNSLSEQFEVLKSRIISSLNGKGGGPVVLAFTSCKGGEGVSCIAANFAACLSEDGDRHVLLADADLRRPSLHQVFPKEEIPQNGTAKKKKVKKSKSRELVRKSRELSTLAWRVLEANNNLDVLVNCPEGSAPAHVYGKSGFSEFLRQARDKYDFIILDCPPVNGPNGSTMIPAKADAAILVIEAERLRREVIQRSITLLEDAGANLLGVVLNKRKYPIPGFIYRLL
jgi:capsular exopolysaccharide synthesis family protein